MDVIAFTKVRLPYGWSATWRRFQSSTKGSSIAPARRCSSACASRTIPTCRRRSAPSHHQWRRRWWRKSIGLSAQSRDVGRVRGRHPAYAALPRAEAVPAPALGDRLLATGDAMLIEDCTARPHGSSQFWGAVRRDGTWEGRNVLGTLWMELRAERQRRSAL